MTQLTVFPYDVTQGIRAFDSQSQQEREIRAGDSEKEAFSALQATGLVTATRFALKIPFFPVLLNYFSFISNS